MLTWIAALAATLLAGNAENRVILHFGNRSCQACQQMQPSIDRLVQEEGWVVRSIDTDRDASMVEKWRVHQTPTILVLQNGREVDRILKVLPYEQLKARLDGEDPDPTLAAIPTNIDPRYANTRNAPRSAVVGRESNLANGPSAVIRGQSPSMVQPLTGAMVPLAKATRQVQQAWEGAGAPRQGQPNAQSDLGQDAVATDPEGATVRIRVDDGRSESVGTGTIIDSVGNEALVLTCGHLFRESNSKSKIEVELFQNGRTLSLPAQLIDFRADGVDIGLIAFRTQGPVPQVQLLPRSEKLQERQKVFSYGCDRGADPSRRDSFVSKLNRYLGASNVEVKGHPVQGRSGGGLFDELGRLIGVCYASDEELDEGLYSGPEVVYQQLDRLGLKRLYDQRQEGRSSIASSNSPAGDPNDDRPLVARSNPARSPSPSATPEIFAVVRESGQQDQVVPLRDAPAHVVEWIQQQRKMR